MFKGFTDETFNFFAAIRFNNNRDFFHANHDWYKRAVRDPALELAQELLPAIQKLDNSLEARPEKVVSRINRDLRFTKDKSPYRDYIWLSYHRPGEEKHEFLEAYFSLSDEGSSFGTGMYMENRPLLNGFRRLLLTEGEEIFPVLRGAMSSFHFGASCFKKYKTPEIFPEDMKPWFLLKNFYLDNTIQDFSILMSPDLPRYLSEGFARLEDIFRIFRGIIPTEETYWNNKTEGADQV